LAGEPEAACVAAAARSVEFKAGLLCEGSMSLVIVTLFSVTLALVIGLAVAGIKFVETAERCSGRKGLFAHLIMAVFASRQFQAQRAIDRYRTVGFDRLGASSCQPGQIGGLGGTPGPAEFTQTAAAAPAEAIAANPYSERRTDPPHANVGAGSVGKSAVSCRVMADAALCKSAKSDEIKYVGNARGHGLTPGRTSAMAASLIPHNRFKSEGPQ
jgi:hypothetical protein